MRSTTAPDCVLGGWAFDSCTRLNGITIGNSVTNIGYGSFSYCSSLTSIAIPRRATSIGGFAFSSCGSLASVSIPDSVKSIGNYAFSSCAKLTSVTMPTDVKNMGFGAFDGCPGLTINKTAAGAGFGASPFPMFASPIDFNLPMFGYLETVYPAIPEPSTIVLGISGAAFLTFLRRKRRW
jgi:hypothetical protein